jgi:hypothetical protein
MEYAISEVSEYLRVIAAVVGVAQSPLLRSLTNKPILISPVGFRVALPIHKLVQ